MSDDLVKMARERANSGGYYSEQWDMLADRIEKLEAALIDILKVPRSEASWGIALVIARHALKEGKDER